MRRSSVPTQCREDSYSAFGRCLERFQTRRCIPARRSGALSLAQPEQYLLPDSGPELDGGLGSTFNLALQFERQHLAAVVVVVDDDLASNV